MHKQVSGWTVNFCPNFPESPFLEFQTRKPPPPFWKTSDLRWPKFTLEYPPILENFKFEMTKVYSGIPPPILENFKFEMTKVYSGIPPHFGKLQIWDDQSLLRNTPPFWKTSDLRWPKFTPKYPPPISENAGDRMWRLICNPQGYHSSRRWVYSLFIAVQRACPFLRALLPSFGMKWLFCTSPRKDVIKFGSW